MDIYMNIYWVKNINDLGHKVDAKGKNSGKGQEHS